MKGGASLLDLIEWNAHPSFMRFVLLFFFLSLSGLFGGELKPGKYVLEMTSPEFGDLPTIVVRGDLSVTEGGFSFAVAPYEGHPGTGVNIKGRLSDDKLIIYFSTETDEGVMTFHMIGSLVDDKDGVYAKGELGSYTNHEKPVKGSWRLLSHEYYKEEDLSDE